MSEEEREDTGPAPTPAPTQRIEIGWSKVASGAAMIFLTAAVFFLIQSIVHKPAALAARQTEFEAEVLASLTRAEADAEVALASARHELTASFHAVVKAEVGRLLDKFHELDKRVHRDLVELRAANQLQQQINSMKSGYAQGYQAPHQQVPHQHTTHVDQHHDQYHGRHNNNNNNNNNIPELPAKSTSMEDARISQHLENLGHNKEILQLLIQISDQLSPPPSPSESSPSPSESSPSPSQPLPSSPSSPSPIDPPPTKPIPSTPPPPSDRHDRVVDETLV